MLDFCNICANQIGFLNPDFDITEVGKQLNPGNCTSHFNCKGCDLSIIARDYSNNIFTFSGDTSLFSVQKLVYNSTIN